MSDIYEKIDRLYSDIAQEERPIWVDELKDELKQIRYLLQNLSNKPTSQPKRVKDQEYYRFVKELREKMRADVVKDTYPELDYNGRRIGVNFKGLMYDKVTSRIISRVEAFEIYDYFYEKRDDIDAILMVS